MTSMSEGDILAVLRSPLRVGGRTGSVPDFPDSSSGVEDLPDTVSGWIADSLSDSFRLDWKKPESFEYKLKRLNKLVTKTKKLGKDIVFIGVSAGAGLGKGLHIGPPRENSVSIYFL